MPWPPQGIYAKKEINTIGDMKGLSWRVYNAGTQRIAQIVGAFPVTIQAADLPQALATGLINAFMTSATTGYDSKAWETHELLLRHPGLDSEERHAGQHRGVRVARQRRSAAPC